MDINARLGRMEAIPLTETSKKFIVLSRIAEELNRRNITWAIGASLLLYLKGIASDFSDIDMMIAESDVEDVKEVLLSFGQQKPANPNVQYKTKAFLEFEIDGVDIDVMAGLVIVNEGVEYYFPLEKDQIRDSAKINGTVIPLQSIEQWRTYYQLMGRTGKVDLIDRHIPR